MARDRGDERQDGEAPSSRVLLDGTGPAGGRGPTTVAFDSGDPPARASKGELAFPIPRTARRGAPAIAVEGIRVQFAGLVALRDVSFLVEEGSRTGLIGPNGAGKTTMFNVLSGLLRPTAGRAFLFGHDVTAMTPPARARAGFGRTFQVPALVQKMTVGENLLIGRHLRMGGSVLSEIFQLPAWWRAERRAKEIAREVAQACGLGRFWDAEVASLPFGTQRLVEVCRAVCSEPAVLALDEPAAGLDTGETRSLGELLKWVQEATGLTVLIIEHDMDMVMEFCDYLYVLDFGTLIAAGSPEDVRHNKEVLKAYLGSHYAEG